MTADFNRCVKRRKRAVREQDKFEKARQFKRYQNGNEVIRLPRVKGRLYYVIFHFISFTKKKLTTFSGRFAKAERRWFVLQCNFFILAIKKRTRPFLSYLLLYFLAAQELWKRKRCCLHEQQHMCDLNSLDLLFLAAKIFVT